MRDKLEIIEVKQIPSLKYLYAYEIRYLNRKGEEKIWELVSRKGIERLESEIYRHEKYSDGTMIVATNPDKTQTVMIREYRVSAGQFIYMFPAGLSDPNETIDVTSKREFLEETGMTFELKTFSNARYTSVGIINEKVEIAYGYYTGKPNAAYQTEDELIEVVMVDRILAKQILDNEEISIRSALILENLFKLNPFINEVK